MAYSLAELKAALGAYTAAFDADLVPPGQLRALLDQAGAIERLASTICALVGARLARGAVDAGGAGRAGSARAAAGALAQATGSSLGDARRAIEAGQALARLPEVGAAARAGELSRDQAVLVAGAAQANPGATAALLAAARAGSLSELAAAAARARASSADLEARRAGVRAARSLREWTDPFGTWQLVARGLPEDGARVMAALGPRADRAFAAARKEDKHEAPEAYGFDALVALAGANGGGPAGYEVMVRVDHSALLRGYATDGETCELAGFGPVSAQVVFDIMETEDPFYKAVLTKAKDVVGVAHLGRRPNAHQRSALDWLYPSCAVAGCGVRSQYCQTDHRQDWASSHVTVFELLDRLCKYHHSLKTYKGWALVAGRGKRAFVAPDDPRHPGPASRSQPGAPAPAGALPPPPTGLGATGPGPTGAGAAPGA